MSTVVRASALDSDKPLHHNVTVRVLDQLLYLSRFWFSHLQNGDNTTYLTGSPGRAI